MGKVEVGVGVNGVTPDEGTHLGDIHGPSRSGRRTDTWESGNPEGGGVGLQDSLPREALVETLSLPVCLS